MQTATISCADPAAVAYSSAVEIFRNTLTEDESKRSWLNDKVTIEDVQSVVKAAHDAYNNKREGSKAGEWLGKLSSRVLFYSSILDVMAQHHPEYVSLAWGSIKFLLRACINHEELIARLSKALTEIAEALPRIKIQASLYDEPVMRRAVSMLYAYIIKFFHRALTWYRKGKVKHFLSAVWSPYELRFKDLREDIARSSRHIDQLAFTASQTELRQMHSEQQALMEKTLEIRQLLVDNHGYSMRGYLESHRRLCEIQFSQILSFTSQVALPPPEQSFQWAKFFNSRRMMRDGAINELWWRIPRLQEWAASSISSFLLVQARVNDRHSLQSFATQIIEVLKALQIPVIWALSTAGHSNTPPTTIDVLKLLVFQALRTNHTLLEKQSPALNPAIFQSARTEKDWLNILSVILADFTQLYIVIDGTIFDRHFAADLNVPHALRDMVGKLSAQHQGPVIKVILVEYECRSLEGAFASTPLDDFTIRLQTRKHHARRRSQGRSAYGATSKGADLLKPYFARRPQQEPQTNSNAQ